MNAVTRHVLELGQHSDNAMPVRPASRRVVAFDGLRGVAAIMVLLHHTLLMLPDFASYEWYGARTGIHSIPEFLLLKTPARLIWAGQERALLFFVLSGFVLSLPWLNGKPAPYGRFLRGRFCRIYPPYLAAMLLAAAASALLGGRTLGHATVYFNELGWAFPASWGAIPSIAAVLDNPHSSYMNEAVWSLVWEVRVAIIFPLVMLPIMRWGNAGVLVALGGLTVAQHAAGLFVGGWITDTLNAPQDTFGFATYFVFGAAVALNRSGIVAWFSRRRPAWSIACLTAGCLACWLPWPVQHDHMVGIGAAIILAAILGGRAIQAWLETPAWLRLGRQSYSLYLTHVPVIMTMAIAFHGAMPLWACAAVLPVAVLVAELFYHAVEMPSVALAQRLLGERRQPPGKTRPPRHSRLAAAVETSMAGSA